MPEESSMATCGRETIQAVEIILVGLAIAVEARMLSAACEKARGYECSNGRCVDLAKVNNSVNDCGDNSDEVSNPCRYPLFSCRNNRCILLDWVLDGNDDCVDQTDEVKRIGTNCSRVASCCRCHEFVPDSECRHQLCQCVRGYYGNDLGTTCTRRVIGDRCHLAIDCNSVIEHSTCDIHFRCVCDFGCYADDKGTTCIKRSIGDRCSLDSDCAQISNGGCVNGSCRCFPGFRRTGSSAFQCTPRLLWENCSTDVDCRLVPNSHCANNHLCACSLGHWPSGDGRLCERTTVASQCNADVDCSTAVLNAVCVDRKCHCSFDHVATSNGSECRAKISMSAPDGALASSLVATLVVVPVVTATIFLFYAVRCYRRRKRQNCQELVVGSQGGGGGEGTLS